MADRRFWPCWFVATALAGIVTGFMLGHALILGRFLDRMLASATPGLLAQTYPVFRGGAGLDAYYAVAGLQVLSGLAFLLIAIAARRHRGAAAAAAL